MVMKCVVHISEMYGVISFCNTKIIPYVVVPDVVTHIFIIGYIYHNATEKLHKGYINSITIYTIIYSLLLFRTMDQRNYYYFDIHNDPR